MKDKIKIIKTVYITTNEYSFFTFGATPVITLIWCEN